MMKKIPNYIAVLTLSTLVLNGCSNILTEGPPAAQEQAPAAGNIPGAQDMPEGYGTIRVSFSRGAARTIMPEADLAGLYLEYWFSRDGETAEEMSPADGVFTLELGSYTLEVKAFVDGGHTKLAGEGSPDTAFTISAGTVAETVNVILRPVVTGTGTGTLEYRLEYPAETTVEASLSRIAGAETYNLAGTASGSGPVVWSGTQSDIPVGYYLLRTTLKNSSGAAGRVEVVHIYQNLNAEVNYTFVANDFRAFQVTSAGDSGPGSLRQVLTDVHALTGTQTIQVALEPGSVIALESALPEVTKSLIIEGNGVTLTRSASWTDISATSQLLYISDSTASVTIRRVHFKNGLATSYGGAIRTIGILTLASCIFSGNRATSTSVQGGAVYSGNTLIIRCCTFYNNSSTYGGVVYFNASGKVLTLTGNLFYGNTAASSYPVVYNSGGTVSASNNVVDVSLGTGAAQAGWAAGTGDTSIGTAFANLPVSPISFKVLFGSGAAAKLPASRPTNYPTLDFYGDTISGSGAAGAVQAVAANESGYYYLDLSVNNPLAGTVSVNPAPDEDGLVPASSTFTITPDTAIPKAGYSVDYWLVDGIQQGAPPAGLTAHTKVQAVFVRTITVDAFTDETGSASTPGTPRYALTNAIDGDIITFSGVTPGTTVIELESALPEVTKSLTIEGNGVTLTRAASWTAGSSQLLYISGSTAAVTIRRVHFKNGLATNYGGAVWNSGILTLDSCMFSGSQTTSTSAYGGAVYSVNTLTIRGCTFYNNSSGYRGGAVYFNASGKTLTLRGNLFYGNTATSGYPVVYYYGTISASYNVVDVSLGTETAQAGFSAATGNTSIGTAFANLPVSPLSFKVLYGSGAAGKLPATLPAGYPALDFYGNTISGNGAAGAVQTVTESGYYYLDLSVNNSLWGDVEVSPAPDEDGLVPASSAFTVTPKTTISKAGYSVDYWLVNGVQQAAAPTGLTVHARVQAVFVRTITVDTFTDGSASTPGTLRYALINAIDGDIITFSGVTPGTTAIELTSALPQVTKSLIIEGNGVTLTRSASWTAGFDTSQLLYISSSTAAVTIRRVHFKNGLATNYGGAVRTAGILTLDSCMFSGSQTTSTSAYGGAVYSVNTLTIRGCTFYNNSSGYRGGSVYFNAEGKTPTLTGNLFYGNTATSYPAVYSYDGIISASYNVVDIPLGTGSARAGFSTETGNTSTGTALANLPVSPISFKVLAGSGARTKLPAGLPEGYPTTDFYGNTISGSGAAGAVQTVTESGYYYLDLSVNNSLWGAVEVNPAPDADGLVPASSTLTASPDPGSGYSVGYWLVNGVQQAAAPAGLSAHTQLRAVFGRVVDTFTDGAGNAAQVTLRYALTNALAGDLIIFSGVTPGATAIELESALPEVTKSITIEGNGVTLTPSASWPTDTPRRLLRISGSTAAVTIRRVHFKNGLVTKNGGAVWNNGILTMESCIFSGNRNTAQAVSVDYSGGAIYSDNTLTLRGCTFYGNRSGGYGGAVMFNASKTLTLTGNLFYGNTAWEYQDVLVYGGSQNYSYNVMNVSSALANLPVSPISFKLLSGSGAANKLPAALPAGYPTTDFYGNTIGGSGAAGAVQAATAHGSGYYYLDLSVNNTLAGTAMTNPAPDADGLVPASLTFQANPNSGYSVGYWLVNGAQQAAAPTSLSAHTSVQAVFNRMVTVDNFTDGTGSENTPGTLRYALTNAQDGDIITFSGVTPGTTVIELASALPEITKSLTIQGSGVTLTGVSYYLLEIRGSAGEVKVNRVHFKNGGVGNSGILTLESCIFNASSRSSSVSSYNTLTLRGCTFYGNTTDHVILFDTEGKTLTLTGNLFYGNSSSDPDSPVVDVRYGGTTAASYNVVDLPLGTGTSGVGFSGGTSIGTAFANLPVSPISFKLLSGSGAAGKLPNTLPAGYPTTDFYGNPISGGGAAGAVQASTLHGSGYYYLDLSANSGGSVSVNPASGDADGLYAGGAALTITASPSTGYSLYWLVNGVQQAVPPTSLTGHTRVRVVFYQPSTVTNISYSGTWTLEDDGTRKSPVINHNDITKTRVNFTSTAANQVIRIQLFVSSMLESGYAFISRLDDSYATSSGNYYTGSRISGNTGVTVSIPVPSEGSHFVDIGYQKDSTQQTAGFDCAWFRVLE